MKCPTCHINQALIHPTYGPTACKACRAKKSPPITRLPEFTSESIKEQRKQFGKDIRPWHNRGQLDKGAVERYGKAAVKKRGFTDAEIKDAKYVWNELEYYKER